MGSFSELRGEVLRVPSAMFLLTDGTLAMPGTDRDDWWRLAPAIDGGYDDGAWSAMPQPTGNVGNTSQGMVLRDGRLLMWLIKGPGVAEIFDPLTNRWTAVPGPSGWYDRDSEILVRASVVLSDGRVMCKSGPQSPLPPRPDPRATWIFDPEDGSWLKFPDPDTDTDANDIESWTLLPDRSVLSIQWTRKRAKRWVGDRWIPTATPPAELFPLYPHIEGFPDQVRKGAQLLVADGKVLVLSSLGHGAYFEVPTTGLGAGAWLLGPTVPAFPTGEASDTGLVALLTNGSVLLQCTPAGPSASPAGVWELSSGVFSPVVVPDLMSFIGLSVNTLLPTGQLMFANGSQRKWLYTPDAPPRTDLAPVITSYPHWVVPGAPQQLKGRRLNGVSQGVDMGYLNSATNYPLVGLTELATGKVTYCRTFEHSSMGVATGDTEITTHFDVPAGLALGKYRLCVRANGLSNCVDVEVRSVPKPDILVKIGPRFQISVILGGIVIGGEDDGSQWVIGPGGIRGPTPGWDPRSSNPAGGLAAGLLQGLSAVATLVSRFRRGPS